MCDTTIVIITVPEPVSIVDDYDTTSRGTSVDIPILDNDFLELGVDTIVTITTNPVNGIATVTDTNTILYSPNMDYCGDDSLVYEVCVISSSGTRNCNTANVYIHVACLVDAVPDVDTVLQFESIDIAIFDNDTVDYAKQGPEIVNGSKYGTASIGFVNEKGEDILTYTNTDPQFCGGFDTLTYRICDRVGVICDTTTVAIYITCANRPPVAVNDIVNSTMVPPGQGGSIDVVANDYDPEGEVIKICGIVTDASHGSVVQTSDSTFNYVPNSSFGSIDSFQYVICDEEGLRDTAWVYIRMCMVPNAFSPNGDGINDVFEISCATGNMTVSLKVFNRWGIEVYSNESYDNSWDGRYNGGPLPDGTYYYVLRFIDNLTGSQIDQGGYMIIFR
jgi:gliding motility-associated-like protein